METPSNPANIPAEHIAPLEDILQVPLTPPGIINAPTDSTTIRGLAYSVVRRIASKDYGIAGNHLSLSSSALEDLQTYPLIQRLAFEVQAANDTLYNWHRPPDLPLDADTDTPRAKLQGRSMRRIVEHSQRAFSEPDIEVDDPLSEGFLLVAPTGVGKSVVQALTIKYAGIGLPISPHHAGVRKAVGVTNGRQLIRDAMNPDETFWRFLNSGIDREIRVGGYYSDKRDGHDEYDVIMTTPESYSRAVASGAIDLNHTVRFSFDEAHLTAQAPTMEEHVASFGSGLYLYTATPAIAGGQRDLRRRFPHLQLGSLLEYVEDGILSPVQLFSYKASPEQPSADIAITLAKDYIEKGLKTLVVCQPGDNVRQARVIANRLNELHERGDLRPHPDFKWEGGNIAQAISGVDQNTGPEFDLLRKGKRLVLTSVSTGMEGVNVVDLNALIMIGPQGAQWVVDQWLGRILRPSGRLAIASEIMPHTLPAGRQLASFFASFGMSKGRIDSGIIIQRRYDDDETQSEITLTEPTYMPAQTSNTDSGKAVPMDLGGLDPADPTRLEETENAEHITPGTEEDGVDPKISAGSDVDLRDTTHTDTIEPYTPPAEVFGKQIHMSYREATVAPSDLAKLPPEDYKPLPDSMLPKDVPMQWLYDILGKLDNPEIRYVGVWETDEDGETHFVRHYSPAAHQYFIDHPVPMLAQKEEMIDQAIADLLHVSRKFVKKVIEKYGIEPLPRIVPSHRSPKYYGLDTVALVRQERDKVPLADESDIPITDLKDTPLGGYIKTQIDDGKIDPPNKRRHPTWGIIGTARHLPLDEYNEIRQKFNSLTVADPDKNIGYAFIAKAAGVTLSTVLNRLAELPEANKPSVVWLRSRPKVKPSEHVNTEWAKQFIEYIRPERVMPWEATLNMIAAYFGITYSEIARTVRRYEIKPTSTVQLKGIAGKSKLYGMHIINFLEDKGFKPAPGIPTFDKAKMAYYETAYTRNPESVKYAQAFQRHFIPPEHLPQTDDELDYYYRRRLTPPQLPREESAETGATDTDTPDNNPYSEQAVCKTLSCSPLSLRLLLYSLYKDTPEELVGELTPVKVKKLKAAISKAELLPPPGYSDVKAMITATGNASIDQITTAWKEIDEEFDKKDVVLCKTETGGVEYFFSLTARRRMRAYILNGY